MYKEALGYGPIQPLKQLNTARRTGVTWMLEFILPHFASVLSRWQRFYQLAFFTPGRFPASAFILNAY